MYDDQYFISWVPHNPMKQDRVIMVVNFIVNKKTRKYGIEVPKNV